MELRDVLPTFLEAAGTSPAHPIDGRSLLPLVSGKDTSWRPWLDLEHGPCYSNENHWNALTDGRYKYIFHAHDAREQLFDIRRDPGETADLAGDAASSSVLRDWRQRMVEHLSTRGEHWVRGGKLIVRNDDPCSRLIFRGESMKRREIIQAAGGAIAGVASGSLQAWQSAKSARAKKEGYRHGRRHRGPIVRL